MAAYDPNAETDFLLELDGQVLVVDAKGEYSIRFRVQRVAPSDERPHGLNYSLTLHGPDGQRVLGFDNAHSVRKSAGPGGRKACAADHQHRMETVRPYRYTNQSDCWRISGGKWIGFLKRRE